MKSALIAFTLLLPLVASAQPTLKGQLAPVVAEAQKLYRSERSSWMGTDILRARLDSSKAIGGYFSYSEGQLTHCIFYSPDSNGVVIAQATFDTSFSPGSAIVNLEERAFTPLERQYFNLRSAKASVILKDKLFKKEKGAIFNIIPLIDSGDARVYVITAPPKAGSVVFGNDFFLRFTTDGKLLERRRLHRNSTRIDGPEPGSSIMHTHLPETGDFVTPTDLCTYMLYAKLMGWKGAYVISPRYTTYWEASTGEMKVTGNKGGF